MPYKNNAATHADTSRRYSLLRHLVPLTAIAVLAVSSISGCSDVRTDPSLRGNEQLGKVYYLDGAGNLGFGVRTVPEGLRRADYRGDYEPIVWTTFTGPLGDQIIRVNAHLQADKFRQKIQKYMRRYPGRPVNIIALSAGTGVAVWALEGLRQDEKIDNLVMLGSSLSNNYDMTEALRHISGKVYVFWSPKDPILNSFAKLTGSIDGQFGDTAGLTGLFPPERASDKVAELYKQKVQNIRWRPAFEAYGYTGNHTDATSAAFVRSYIAPRLFQKDEPVEQQSRQVTDTWPEHTRLVLLGVDDREYVCCPGLYTAKQLLLRNCEPPVTIPSAWGVYVAE